MTWNDQATTQNNHDMTWKDHDITLRFMTWNGHDITQKYHDKTQKKSLHDIE